MRLQRYLAQAGVAARRKAEELITAGRVRVNGSVVTELGTQVGPKDRVEVDGRLVRPEDRRYLLLNKPVGYVTTLEDPEGRPTIRDLLPLDGPRLFPVGRLDLMTEGALICTNDGDLANALTHPSRRVPKRYLARVRGHLEEEALKALTEGVLLEDGRTAPALVLVHSETTSHTWLDITVYEGRNRLVRRMCEAVGHPVVRLNRTAFAGIEVEPLRRGAYRILDAKEIARLRKLAGLPAERSRQKPLSGPPGRSQRQHRDRGSGRGAGRSRSRHQPR
jgi:pseudouridine synthase